MNVRLLSLTWQNEHCTHNYVTVQCIVSKLIWTLGGLPRNPLMMSQSN